MKGLFTMSMLCLVLFWTSPALAENVTVTATGKDAATAELNARVAAVRQVLQETAAMDFLVSKMDMVRKELILKSRDFTSTVTVLASEKVSGTVRVKATVETDRDKIRQRLLGIDPKAVAAPPAVPAPVPKTPASEPEPVRQTAAAPPSGPALPDEEFLTMLVLAAPLEDRLAAIRNGANPNAVVADWEMSDRIMKAVQKDGRIKKAVFTLELDAVFAGKTALMLVADDYLSTEAEAIAVMEALVAAGADINAKDYSGRNVLMYMQKHLWPNFFTAFLAHKPDIEAVMDKPKDARALKIAGHAWRLGTYGSTPLLYSSHSSVPAEVKPGIRKALLRAGADPNKKAEAGGMFLPTLATDNTDLELFTLALESGAQPYGKTLENLLKHKPERENRMAMLEALLKIDTEDKNWKQAGLYEACKKFEGPELIRLFLKHGADVNATQSLGYTLLMLNLIDARCVPLLVEAGADVNSQNPQEHKRTPLIYAVGATKPDLALALLAAGADPNVLADERSHYRSALLKELGGEGRVELVKALLDAGAKMDVTDSRGSSLLQVATMGKGGVAVLELLKERGVDVKAAVKPNEESALFHAARANKADVVEWLVRAGVDVNRATDKGKTALHAAMENWRGEEATKALIRAGADVNAVYQEYGTPLFMAAGVIYPEAVKSLLESGADVNLPGRDGKTPLMRAVENSYVDVVAILLDAGADPSLKDEKGKTAWDLTEGSRIWENPKYDAVKQRLQSSAKSSSGPAAPDKDNVKTGDAKGQQIALMDEITSSCRPEVVKQLLDAGADLTGADSRGRPVVMAAVAAACGVEALQLLKEKGADINAKRGEETALTTAVAKQKPAHVAWLIAAGASLEADKYGRNALDHATVYRDNHKVVAVLVEAGFDVTVWFSDGTTPLHRAAALGETETARLLLHKGADVNARTKADIIGGTKAGITALMVAVRTNPDLAAVLLDAGADTNLKDGDGKTAWDILQEPGPAKLWSSSEYDAVKRRLKLPAG